MSGAAASAPASTWRSGACEAVLPSPFGPFRVTVDDEGRLVRADFVEEASGGGHAVADVDSAANAGPAGDADLHPALARAVAQLTDYFAGRPVTFDVPVAPRGTDFERRVWAHLTTIPYGRTTSYGAVAAAIGQPPDAARAVGAANARNPIAVVIPCHRVIGADGSLVGYAAGLDRKRGLLAMEHGQPTLGLFL